MKQHNNPISRPIRAARNAAFRIARTDSAVDQLRSEISNLTSLIESMSAKFSSATDVSNAATRALADSHNQLREMLHLLHDNDGCLRDKLWTARAAAEYEQAYDETEPLVTVTIPTFRNTQALFERSLPSVLAQSYERMEILIVGDAAAPEVGDAVRRVGDPRIVYSNMTQQWPLPEDPLRRWYVAGGAAANHAWRAANGLWIAPMNDDDVFATDHVEVLLEAARSRRLEFCYGMIRQVAPDGQQEMIGEFPPDWGKFGLQAAILHRGIRFFDTELGDATFDIVGDWARVRRMVRAGVRIGMVNDVVLDYYPTSLWGKPG